MSSDIKRLRDKRDAKDAIFEVCRTQPTNIHERMPTVGVATPSEAMTDLFKRIEHRIVKPGLRRLKPWRYDRYGDIRVRYKEHLDGGGRTNGLDYLPLFRDLGMPRQARVFEWCAGPAFIGFALLGYGFCDSLCVADVNPDAITACRRTVADNRLAARVAVYHSDNLDDIPATEQWDLVVGNPPHFADSSPGQLRYHDADWRLHRRFFASVGRHLKPGGMIVLLENNFGSTAETFRGMIEAAGFSILFVHNDEARRTPYPRIYFIGIARRGDTAPAWATTAGQSPQTAAAARAAP
jgi:SAM-dependent methyltransferase